MTKNDCKIENCTERGKIQGMCVAHAVLFVHLIQERLTLAEFDELAALPVDECVAKLNERFPPPAVPA